MTATFPTFHRPGRREAAGGNGVGGGDQAMPRAPMEAVHACPSLSRAPCVRATPSDPYCGGALAGLPSMRARSPLPHLWVSIHARDDAPLPAHAS